MDKIEQILQQMTLEDKIALCSGESFWETKAYEKHGIPALFLAADKARCQLSRQVGIFAEILKIPPAQRVTLQVGPRPQHQAYPPSCAPTLSSTASTAPTTRSC